MSSRLVTGEVSARPSWAVALGATLLLQTVTSFAVQTLPVIAPLVTSGVGLPPESVGYAMGLLACGTVLYLVCGGPLLARLGPVRTLQAGAGLAALALLGATAGTPAALLAAALVLGIGNGPGVPAGSRILARAAPAGHHSLTFSANRTGVPLGGALAGLMVPFAVFAMGWRAAVVLIAGAVLVAVIAVQSLRATFDARRDRDRAVGPAALLRPANLASSLAALRLHPLLWPLAALACSLGMTQSCLFAFTVTYLIEARGWVLAEAGVAFAVMQAASMAGRLLLGWLADRTGTPLLNLVVQAVAAAALMALFALLPAGTSHEGVALVLAATGLVAAGWNGIALAEATRLSPPNRVGDVTAGAALVAFLGGSAGPVAFAAAVSVSGGWTMPLLAVAAQTAFVAATLAPRLIAGMRRSRDRRAG
jgi:MFS family permease